MAAMPDAYTELLDATIHHLESLKNRGVRFVPVSPQNLAALDSAPRPASAAPVRRVPTAPAAKPAESPRSAPAPTALFTPPVAPVSTAPALSPEAKAAAFADLRARTIVCVKCPHLASSRKNVVFGVGNIDSPLLFVGEAPGADEDEQGEPFVGKAGQLLTKIIQTMGLDRSKTRRKDTQMSRLFSLQRVGLVLVGVIGFVAGRAF